MLGNQTAVGLAVDGHHRRETAGAHAAQDVQRELAVLGDAALGNLEFVFERVQDLLGTLDIARRTQAHGNRVLALRLHGEEAVEGHDTVHPADGNAQAVGHDLLDFFGKVAEMALRFVQDVDQLTRIVIEGSADILDNKVIGFSDFYFGSTHGSMN